MPEHTCLENFQINLRVIICCSERTNHDNNQEFSFQSFSILFFTSSMTLYSRQELQFMHLILWSPWKRLSTRLDNELDINLKLSINFMLYEIVFPFSSYFFIGTEEVLHFSVFSLRHSNCRSNSSVIFLIIRWYLEPLWNIKGSSFCVLYFVLQILWAAPLYLPV